MVIDSQFFNQPDSRYYGKQIILDRLSFDVLASPEKAGIWLSGPFKWPPLAGGALPMAIIWKTSTKENTGTSPETHGHLVLSRENGGEPVLLKLFTIDKLPLEGDDSKPNSRPPEEDEQFSVGGDWFDVDDRLLLDRPGVWIATVISGSAISNVHRFEVLGSGAPPLRNSETFQTPPLSNEEMKAFLGGKEHPATPNIGIDFKLAMKDPGKDSPYLYGAFAFPVLNDEGPFLHLAALFSGPNYEDMRRIPVSVPLAATRIVDGKRVGFFSINLQEKLGNPRQKTFTLPSRTYLTLVGRNWIGKPSLLDSTGTK